VRRRRDVFRSFAWRKSMFFPSANHPVVDLESSWIHFDFSVLLTDQKGTWKRRRFGCDSNKQGFRIPYRCHLLQVRSPPSLHRDMKRPYPVFRSQYPYCFCRWYPIFRTLSAKSSPIHSLDGHLKVFSSIGPEAELRRLPVDGRGYILKGFV
jgi:hypothetical protein